jgi:hypothetical protein
MSKETNNLEYIRELNNIEYIDSVNKFLNKFFFINIILNIVLYFANSEFIAFISYLISIIFFLIFFKKKLKSNLVVLIGQIFSIFLVILTYITFILTFLVNNIIFEQSVSYLLVSYLYSDLSTYFLANLYLIFFSLSVLIFNKFIPKKLLVDLMNKIDVSNCNFSTNKIRNVILITILVEFIYYISGTLGSQQSGGFILADAEDKTTWYTQLFSFIMIFHVLLNIIYLRNIIRSNHNFISKIFLLSSFLINFLFFGFSQRRNILVFCIVNFIFFILIIKKKLFSFKMIFVYVLSFFLIYQSFTFLGTIRKLQLTNEEMSLKEIISQGEVFQFFSDKNINQIGKETFVENLRMRMFNNHELSTLFYYESSEFLNGRLLLSQFIQVIPSVVYVGKVNYTTQEDLITTMTNSPLYFNDTVDSIQSYAYIDFGLLGLMIYPILLNLLIFTLYKIANYKKISSLTILFIFGLIIELITLRVVETNLTYWFVLIRNILLFAFFFNFLLSKLYKKNMNI